MIPNDTKMIPIFLPNPSDEILLLIMMQYETLTQLVITEGNDT